MYNLDPHVNTNELLNRHQAEKTHKQITQQQNNTQHIKNKTKKNYLIDWNCTKVQERSSTGYLRQ